MRQQQRQPRRRRKHVVGGLAHVDVIVRVHQPVLALRAAEDLRRAVGEHLVDVHVVRGAGASLVDVDDELIARARRRGSRPRPARWRRRCARSSRAERDVGLRRGLLDEHRGGDEVGGRAQAADREVLDRTGRLDAVVRIGGNGVFAEGIAFDAHKTGRESFVELAWQV